MKPSGLCLWCGKERHPTRVAALATARRRERRSASRPIATPRAGDGTWDSGGRIGGCRINPLSRPRDRAELAAAGAASRPGWLRR